ncbi:MULTISPECIES: hypothetical protein [unclassified Diaminobutyricimonas]|uniref:hypothetical protein n=1 Tax=unclassified Diaminobutyricimonas TaxID=2643261 RepID=UPI0018E018C2|nr:MULTISPECIES: hypothetical protein [unclassified Diaminobutyricimonas]
MSGDVGRMSRDVPAARTRGDAPSAYEIRLQGRLDERWADWFEGMSLSTEADGTTVLRGIVADQSALHGILGRVRDLGMTLISVNSGE